MCGGGVSYNFIDLGLPSGLLWADRNIGAATPEDAGLYFQWGDTQGWTAEQVGVDKDFGNYKFSSGGTYTKYNETDGKRELDLEDDAAHVIIGGNCKMPTHRDFFELFSYTDIYLITETNQEINGILSGEPTNGLYNGFEWKTTTTENVIGIKFCKKNDNSTFILIPYGGIVRGDSLLINKNTQCHMWIPMINQDFISTPMRLSGDRDDVFIRFQLTRNYGCPIRAIKPINQ